MSFSAELVIATPIDDPDPAPAVSRALLEAGVRPGDRRSVVGSEQKDAQAWVWVYKLIIEDPDHVEACVRASLAEQGTTVLGLTMRISVLEPPVIKAPGVSFDLATCTLTVERGSGELEIGLARQADQIVALVDHENIHGFRQSEAVFDVRHIVIRPQ